MAVLDERGYLETPYLQRRYLSSEIDFGVGMQVDMKVNDQVDTGMEVNLRKFINEPTGMQVDMKTDIQTPTGMQADLRLFINEPTGMQVDQKIFDQSPTGMEVKVGFPQHIIHGSYLSTFPYLTAPYLSAQICALGGMQVDMFVDRPEDDSFNGMQVDRKIDTTKLTGMQTQMRVFTDDKTGMQVQRIRAERTGFQATMVIYNTTQMRVLCDFPSRGLVSANWTSPQGTEAGDFGLSNLNTDVIEQRAQSPSGVIALWELISDTGASNTFADTIAILNHNFTSSAVVTVQGSDDISFVTVKFSFVMTTELTNMYYIAPTLPTQSARYYKFLIQDATNPDNYLSVGTIVFGSSLILTRRTCFENPVQFGLKHFKDSLETEGYTSVSNDRALRKVLGLEFVNLKVDGADYGNLTDYFKTAKTDLKCLVIPKPERPSTLAVFSKLVELPIERHMANTEDDWRVELNLDYDESL